jgi:hypothetical protein
VNYDSHASSTASSSTATTHRERKNTKSKQRGTIDSKRANSSMCTKLRALRSHCYKSCITCPSRLSHTIFSLSFFDRRFESSLELLLFLFQLIYMRIAQNCLSMLNCVHITNNTNNNSANVRFVLSAYPDIECVMREQHRELAARKR